MADDKLQDHQAFFGLRMKEDGDGWSQFSYGDDLDRLKSWGSGEDQEESREKDDEDKQQEVEPSEISEEGQLLGELMYRVIDSGFALSELTLSSSAIKNLFSSIISRAEVVDPIRENCPIVYEDEKIKVYGISADRLTKVREQHRRLVRMDRGFDLLPSAVLLTIVATFDSLTAEIVRTILSIKPDRFNKSDKMMSVAEILSMDSFEDVKSKLVDDEVYQYSRGSHDEQVKDIERWFHIKIADSWKRWPDFIEIFERRNLIAHGEKAFTKRYVEICLHHGHKGSEKLVGEEIKLTTKYLSQSLDVLVEFCIVLVFSIWRKQLPEEEVKAFEVVNDVCYKLITDDRYRVPVRVIEYVLSLKGTDVTESTRLMLIVNLASAYRHRDEKDQAIKVLDGVDWSAVSDNFRVCVAALREDVDEVAKLMGPAAASGKVRKEDFREWPVFSFVRENEKFQSEFENIFGEQLFDPANEATDLGDSQSVVENPTAENGTMH